MHPIRFAGELVNMASRKPSRDTPRQGDYRGMFNLKPQTVIERAIEQMAPGDYLVLGNRNAPTPVFDGEAHPVDVEVEGMTGNVVIYATRLGDNFKQPDGTFKIWRLGEDEVAIHRANQSNRPLVTIMDLPAHTRVDLPGTSFEATLPVVQMKPKRTR